MWTLRAILMSLVLIVAGCVSINRDEGPEHHGWHYYHYDED